MTLHYKFPIIHHIDDVLPHIADKPEFIKVVKDGGYTVINYVFQSDSTFPPVSDDSSAILRECRGIIFDTATGKILSRRFSKFFNLGEKPDTTDLDVSRPHHVLDKLDGSMISPLMVGGGIRWASKMGITDVSMQAEVFVQTKPEYTKFSEKCLRWGKTPIFEWLSAQNRIVLDYGPDQLTLIAVRDNVDGIYASRSDLEGFSAEYGLPLVDTVSTALSSVGQFVEELRQKENVEGVVITFNDGHMVKVKTDWYVQLHRAKDKIARERHLIALILDDGLDDLLPVLSDEDKNRVKKFADAINYDLSVFSEVVECIMLWVRSSGTDRKSFALSSDHYSPPVRAACFHMFSTFDGDLHAAARDWGVKFIKKNLGSQTIMENRAREVLRTARWKEIDL